MSPTGSTRADGDLVAGVTLLPLTVRTDPRHGGRWTSLVAGGREWLWHHPDRAVILARECAVPGDPFADAGGVEECVPTIHGLPDHGAAWSVPWESRRDSEVAYAEPLTVARTLAARNGRVRAAYSITGSPGTPFVHAVHALLDLGPQARLVVPEPQTASIIEPEGDPGAEQPWPPMIARSAADEIGDVDGTASAILLPGCHRVTVVDGEDSLELSWNVSDENGATDGAGDDPCSLLVWRNLGGWPATAPYRSIGVEPMVGRTTTVAARSRPDDPPAATPGAVRLPATGRFDWVLRISARRRTRHRRSWPSSMSNPERTS